jgi:hypothetical protein
MKWVWLLALGDPEREGSSWETGYRWHNSFEMNFKEMRIF